MSFTDLTGRHVVTPHGAPIVHADGGAWGLGYTEFEGTGHLVVDDPDLDFNFLDGDHCIEIEGLVRPDGHFVDRALTSTAILDTERAFDATYRWALFDNGLLQSMQDTFGYNYDGAAAGWNSIKIDRQAGVTRQYLNNVLVSTTTGVSTRAAWGGVLRVACYYNGVTEYPTVVSLSALRITRASRLGLPRFAASQVGAADPLWSDTVLLLSLGVDPVVSDDDPLGMIPDEPLKRAVINSLFSWRRARPEDALPAESRQGWWGDTYPVVTGDQWGSRLWLLSRAKLLPDTVARAREYTQEALAWMIEDGVAARVDVDAEVHGIDTLAIACRITRSDGTVADFRFDNVWEFLRNV
jgi:phage gp46-like protein